MPVFKKPLLKVIEELEIHISVIHSLKNSKESLINRYGEIFYRKAFVRSFCYFCEACSFLREKNDNPIVERLQITSEQGKSVPEEFARYRNRLVHDYIYTSLQGETSLFNEAETYFFAQAPSFIIALNKCKAASPGDELQKIRLNKRPATHMPDNKYKLYDYIAMLRAEIAALESLMITLKLDLTKITVQDIEAALQENKFLGFVFQNFVENLCTMLLDLHSSSAIKYVYCQEQQSCLDSLSKPLKDFILIEINEIRKKISHGFSGVIDTSSNANMARDLVHQFVNFVEIRKHYFKLLENNIKQGPITRTPRLADKIPKQNAILIYSSSSSTHQPVFKTPFADAKDIDSSKKRQPEQESTSKEKNTAISQKKTKHNVLDPGMN